MNDAVLKCLVGNPGGVGGRERRVVEWVCDDLSSIVKGNAAEMCYEAFAMVASILGVL